MRGGMGPLVGRSGDSPWSDLPVSGGAEVPPRSVLPLNRVLYIPFSIFSYSSNMVIGSLVRINSTLVEGTLKWSRFSLNSVSFRDRVPVMKLSWCVTQPDRYMTLISATRRDSYCVITPLIDLTMQWLVTSDMCSNSSRQITPDFVFVGILNAIPSGLLFQSRSSSICSWKIPCCLRVVSARVNGRCISESLDVFHSVISTQWLNTSGNSWTSSVQTVRKLFPLLIQIKHQTEDTSRKSSPWMRCQHRWCVIVWISERVSQVLCVFQKELWVGFLVNLVPVNTDSTTTPCRTNDCVPD